MTAAGTRGAARLGRGLVLGLVLVAAGCVPPPKPQTDEAGTAATEDVAVLVPVVPPTPAPPPPVLPEVKAAELVGYGRDAVTALLGAPDFARRDAPAELLQYRSTSCVLDLFLYDRDAGAAPRVDHVEARSRSLAAADADDCLGALLRARANAER